LYEKIEKSRNAVSFILSFFTYEK